MHQSSRNEIVGRVAELSSMDRLVAGIAGGHGDLIWVQGEPGVGKTVLVNAAMERASALGCQVLQGVGDELVEPFPLRLMADCLGVANRPNSVADRITSFLSGERSGAGALDPVIAASEQMLEMVNRIRADGPVVLVAEDLQWADEPSLLVWSRLARLVSEIPMLLIGVARPRPDRVRLAQLRDLVIQRGGVGLDLGPLDDDGVTSLAGRIAGGTPGPRLRAALGRAAGNPLYVRELSEALVKDGLVRTDGGTAELDGDAGVMPSSLTAAISGRLSFLPRETRKALAVAALLGTEFDAAEWAAAVGQPVSRIGDFVQVAVTAGVLCDAAERLRFRDELVHQVLVEQTPTAMRGAMHSDIARLMARAGCEADSVARQLLAAGGTIADWALDWLADLPETAFYGVQRALAELLARAVEMLGGGDLRRETLGVRLARMLLWMGRDEQAREIAGAVARLTADPLVAARMRLQIIRSAWRTGSLADGLRAAQSRPGDELLPAGWRARLTASSAIVAEAAGQSDRGAALAADALQQASASGDPLAIGYARHALALRGNHQTRLEHLEAGLDAVKGPGPEAVDQRLLLLTDYVNEHIYQARPEETGQALKEALTLAGIGSGFRAAAVHRAAAWFCYTRGRWDEALSHLARVDDEFAGPGPVVMRHGLTALIALRRGDLPSADASLRAAPGGTETSPAAVFPLMRALAARAEAADDPASAAALLSRWLAAEPGPRARDRHNDLPYLVRLTLAAGDTATAAKAAEAAAADASADGSASANLAARLCRAMIDDDVDELLAVADRYQACGQPPGHSFTLVEAAVRLAAAGETARARAALTDAARLLSDLGAATDIRRADARLRPYGIRRGPRSAHRRETTGWKSLTPSEVRIAELVAEDLSNPEIAARLYLSRRTVQTHVSNILSKLRVSSRAGIVRAAAEHAAGERTAEGHALGQESVGA